MDISEMESQINALKETIAVLNGKIIQMESTSNVFASHDEVTELENRVGALVSQGEFVELESKVSSLPKLTQMTVTDSRCRLAGRYGEIIPVYSSVTVEASGSIPGGTVEAPNPYLFYAAERIVGGSSIENIPAKEVQMALPIGGSLSGLYRFPRVGEKILVAETDRGNFLMGYLPSSLTPFLDTTETGVENIAGTLEEKGEVLRYETPGLNLCENSSFSEIGFYSHEADWPIKQEGEFVYKDEEKTELAYPRIDRLKIQSTGDIRSTAENHHLIRAKRFEILAGCPEVNHRTDKTADDKLPLGDNPGDDSVLHGGDVHIRAGNRVVIKAEQEICLQVGRTVLSLSDQGFTVKSKVTNSNFENVLDATLGLSPRDGINMFGYNVNVSSAKGFQIGDSYGGSISSTIGVVGVNGREVKLTAYDAMEYAFTTLYALFQFIQCSASGGAALDGAEDVNTAQYVKFTFDMVQRIIEVVKNVYEGYKARQQTKEIEDEAAAAQVAERELEQARADAKKAEDDLAAAEAKLSRDAEAAADADSQAQKAKEDADAKKVAAEDAANKETQANEKLEADKAAEQKARKEREEAESTADRTKADADDTEAKARVAKEQADSDADTAAQKKKDADDARAAADKAEKAADVDEKQLEVIQERIKANEESAEKHEATAEAARQSAKDHADVLGSLEKEGDLVKTKRDQLNAQIAEQQEILNSANPSKKARKEAEKKLQLLETELKITDQTSTGLGGQSQREINGMDRDTRAAESETAKANEARQSADQKRAEADETRQKLTTDQDTAAKARQDADAKQSDYDDAQGRANQSKGNSDAADTEAKAKRKDADDAQNDLDQKTSAQKTAEENTRKSQKDADDAGADVVNKTTSANEAAADADAKKTVADEKKETVGRDTQSVEDARVAKDQADANLAEKEAQAQAAKQKHDAAVAETRSSALTDEFDQAIDIEGEQVHYEQPDYKPPEETRDGSINEGLEGPGGGDGN